MEPEPELSTADALLSILAGVLLGASALLFILNIWHSDFGLQFYGAVLLLVSCALVLWVTRENAG